MSAINFSQVVDNIVVETLAEAAERNSNDRKLASVQYDKLLHRVNSNEVVRQLCQLLETATGETTRVGLSDIRSSVVRLSKPSYTQKDGNKALDRPALVVIDPTAARGEASACTVEEFSRWDAVTVDEGNTFEEYMQALHGRWAEVLEGLDSSNDRWAARAILHKIGGKLEGDDDDE